MIYGNKFLNEGFFDKFKKKKKEVKKQEPKKTKRIEFTSEEEKSIYETLKQIVKEYNSNSDNKNEINDTLKERGIDDEKFTKFVCNKLTYFNYVGELAYEVCENTQDVRMAACVIIGDMAEELQKRLRKKGMKVSCDGGDGDEGCVYISNDKTE